MKTNPTYIHWTNDENYFFINPREENSLKNQNNDIFEQLKGHLFLYTSGTKAKKCIALSKKAFLHSAQSVNHHLQAHKKDKWLAALPLFHVGGLSILARSFLSQSPLFIMEGSWSPKKFLSHLEEHQITLTSLVPAQVYDLALHKIKAPDFLKAVVVGGGALHKNLYHFARSLNWPLLPSYGMTETSSQIATASINSLKVKNYPSLEVLKHCQIKICQEGKIAVKSPALFTGWMNAKTPNKFERPFHQGWFVSEDSGQLENSKLTVFDRDHMCKINGENVSLYELENTLMKILMDQKCALNCQLLHAPHPRTGSQIILASSNNDLHLLELIRKKFNIQVRPFEKIQNCYFIPSLPAGRLSKIQTLTLKRYLGFDIS